MSYSEFLSTAVLPAGVQLNESLTLTAQQRHDIEKMVEARGDEIIDYKYAPKEQALARTAIADLKDSDCWGTCFGLAAYGASFWMMARRTQMARTFTGRKFLHMASVLVGGATYWGITQNAHSTYRGVAGHINTRVSQELSEMMNLKKPENKH